MIASLRTRWLRFWFAPALPTNLAVCRIVFFGALAVFYASHDFSAWADVSRAFWNPVWPFARLDLPVLTAVQLVTVQRVWKVALVLACLGFMTRLSTTTVLVLGFYLLGLSQNFGKIHHHDAILIFVFAILALSRCGDALSVDRLLGRLLRRRPMPVPTPSGEYTWPIRMVWLVLSLLFLGAGVSKLRSGGLEWIFSDNLAIFFVQHHYHYGNAVPLTAWGLALAQHPWLCRVLAAATIAGELGYPLALVSRRARLLVVPGALLMQMAIRVLLGPTFVELMVCNVFWVPWDHLRGRAFTSSAHMRLKSPRPLDRMRES